MFIKKGDTVAVISGKDTGKTGKVLKVVTEKNRAAIEGVNIIKKHTRPNKQNQQGGIIEKEGTVHVSNLQLFCSKCNRGVRVGNKVLDDKSKIRVCKKCGEQI